MGIKIGIALAVLLLIGLVALSPYIGRVQQRLAVEREESRRYQLADHGSAGATVLGALTAAPESPEAWLDAAKFELADNSPHGAAYCLEQAERYGATVQHRQPLQDQYKIVLGRWTALSEALLLNGRYLDGNNEYADIYAILDRFVAADSEAPLRGKARADYDLLRAHLLLKEGRREEARAILEVLREEPWPLQALCNYLHAKTFFRDDDPRAGIAAYTAFVADYPQDRLAAYALVAKGELAVRAGDLNGARAAFERVVADHAESTEAPEARLHLLDLQMGVAEMHLALPSGSSNSLFELDTLSDADASEPKGGAGTAAPATSPPPDTNAAAQPPPATQSPKAGSAEPPLDPRLIPGDRDGWDRYGALFHAEPEAPAIHWRAWQLFDTTLRDAPVDDPRWALISPETALGWAEALRADGRVKSAETVAAYGLKTGATGSTRIDLARIRARLQIAGGRTKEARTGLEQVLGTMPVSADLGSLYYEMARAFRAEGQPGTARTWYLRAAAVAADELAADAWAQGAWGAAQSGNWQQALQDYVQLIARFPESEYADIARDHLLSEALRKGHTDTALALAADLAVAKRGQRRVKGRYFTQVLKHGVSIEWTAFFGEYPFTIYGTYAAKKLGRSYSDLDLDALPVNLLYEDLRAQETSVAGAAFLAGLWDIAEAEWDLPTADPNDPFRALGIALIASAGDNPVRSILDSQEFFDLGGQSQVPRGWSATLLEAAWPIEYEDEIRRHATTYNLPPSLVLGIIRQETYFNTRATSHAGARGLMQLMPATATWAGEQVGVGRVSNSQLFEPDLNIRLGCWHLDFLKRAGGSSFGLLLAAHNGGPGNLERWKSATPEWRSDEPLFLELIPNRETREFAKVVLVNHAIYEYRLAAGARANAVF